MKHINRPSPFVLTSTAHGSMIVNRLDYRLLEPGRGYGMGFQLFNNSCYDMSEVQIVLQLIESVLKHKGPGILALDCGANIGVHTVEWSKRLAGGAGEVIGIEAQERIYYALAGNVALNNCLNASVLNAAVGAAPGVLNIPVLDYTKSASFGSFELKKRDNTEFIGQEADYENNTRAIPVISVDAMELERLDFIKIDVEGMELDVIEGAKQTLERDLPVMVIEIIKTDKEALFEQLTSMGYVIYAFGMNVIAVHQSHPTYTDMKGNQVLRSPA